MDALLNLHCLSALLRALQCAVSAQSVQVCNSCYGERLTKIERQPRTTTVRRRP